jgi:hypothetical protein
MQRRRRSAAEITYPVQPAGKDRKNDGSTSSDRVSKVSQQLVMEVNQLSQELEECTRQFIRGLAGNPLS